MKMSEVNDAIAQHLIEADDHIQQALDLADQYGAEFSYRPTGVGHYTGVLTHQRALELVESGEYSELDEEIKDRVDEIIKTGNGEYEDQNYDIWQSSFC